MNVWKRLGTSRVAVLVLLLVALATSMALLLPAKAYAVPCCGRHVTIYYYSDATKTVKVGQCVNDDCAGTEVCSGQQTIYTTSFGYCCDTCG
jgi:hypothetical protein